MKKRETTTQWLASYANGAIPALIVFVVTIVIAIAMAAKARAGQGISASEWPAGHPRASVATGTSAGTTSGPLMNGAAYHTVRGWYYGVTSWWSVGMNNWMLGLQARTDEINGRDPHYGFHWEN